MVNKGSKKCRVYDNLLKNIFKRLGVLIATCDYSKEVLKLVNKGSQKCRVYEHLLKKLLKRLGVLIATSLNPCVLRGSF